MFCLAQWARAALRHTHAMIVVAVLAVAAVVIVVMTQDGRVPKVSAGADTEVSSQAKRVARFAPTPAQWASLGMEPVKAMTFRSEHMTEGKISINEDQGDADLSALCRAGDPADGQAGRHGGARPAAVLHRSRRHGAGAERFPHRACRHQPGEVARDDHRDHREAEPHALRGQGRARCATSRPRRPISPRRAPICAPPNPRSKRRAIGLPFSARPMPRSRRSRSRARSAPRRRSMRRCPARSCSARSAPANTSATPAPASSIRSSPSATCRPCGSSPMSAKARRRRSAPGSSSISPCSPIRRRRSRPTSTTSPRRSIRTSAA